MATVAEVDSAHSILPARWWPHAAALGLIAIELCWIIPWYRTLIQITYVASPLRAGLVLGGIMIASYLLMQALAWGRLIKVVRQGLLVGLFVFGLILAERALLNSQVLSVTQGLVDLDPGAVLVLFAVLWVWWRGVSLAGNYIYPRMAWRRFELGLAMLLAHVFILTRLGGDPIGIGLFSFYLFLGLVTMVLARVAYVSQAQKIPRNPFDRRWLTTTALIVTLIVGIAVILGSLLTGQYKLLFEWVAEVVRLLVAVVIFILSIPGLILSYFLQPFGPLIRWLMARPRPTPTPDPYATLYPGAQAPLTTPPEPAALAPWLQVMVFWTIILALMIGAILVARRRMQDARRWNSDDVESLLSPGDAGNLLRKAVQDRLNEAASRLAALRTVQRAMAAARVRQIYIDLMALCNDLKYPRPAARTPLEFLPDLGELFPGCTAELALITRSYNQVRYGSLPETREEIEALNQAWERVQLEGEQLKRAKAGVLKTAERKDVERQGV